MLKKIQFLIGLFFLLALITFPNIAVSGTEPSPIDPVLLKQIQASLEDDRNQAKIALAKARSELQSISDPAERKRKEEGINKTEKEFQDRFAATQEKLEKNLMSGGTTETRSASTSNSSAIAASSAQNLATLQIYVDAIENRQGEIAALVADKVGKKR